MSPLSKHICLHDKDLFVNLCPLWNKTYLKKERTVSIAKVVCKTKHAFASRQRVLILITILHCICSNVPTNILIIIFLHPPHPTPFSLPSPLRRAVFTQRLVSGHVYEVNIADHRSCRSENQNTSVILPRR